MPSQNGNRLREMWSSRHSGMSFAELQLFTLHLNVMLKGGVGLVTALSTLGRSAQPRLAAVSQRLVAGVEGGTMLSRVMARETSFPAGYIRVIMAGESTGCLSEAVDRLALNLDKAGRTRERLRSALVYPSFIVLSALAMVAVLVYGLLPMLVGVTTRAGVPPPLLTRGLLFVANPIFLLFGLGAGALGAAFLYAGWNSRSYGPSLRRQVEMLPVVGPFWVRWTLLSAFREFAMMTENGVDLVRALTLASEMCRPSVVLHEAMEMVVPLVRNGSSLADALSHFKVFPRALVGMIGVGEETGDVEILVNRYTDLMEQDLGEQIERLTSMLEPLVMAALGLVVGVIVLAAFLPVYSLVRL